VSGDQYEVRCNSVSVPVPDLTLQYQESDTFIRWRRDFETDFTVYSTDSTRVSALLTRSLPLQLF
jgi:hypothetical protein